MTRSHSGERDAVGMVDEEAHGVSPDDLREQHLDVWLGLGQARLDLGLDAVHGVSLLLKVKVGARPLSETARPAWVTGARKLVWSR